MSNISSDRQTKNGWEFTNDVRIGIDVGWSERTRSCAMAIRGATPPEGGRWKPFASNEEGVEPVHVGLFRLSELLDCLRSFVSVLSEDGRRTTLIVDGPVGRDGEPRQNRHIDSACRCNGFNRRTQPSDIEAINGDTYVEATYKIIRSFFSSADFIAPWWGGVEKVGWLTYAETHPTVGLALLLPPQPRASGELPSRKRPLSIGSDLIRAKSDWYWRKGAGAIVSTILKCPEIASEVNHERVAGLYCLAVADLLSYDASNVVAIGDVAGIYVVPRRELEVGWTSDIERVKWIEGRPDDVDGRATAMSLADPLPISAADSQTVTKESDSADDTDTSGKADNDLDLVFNDNYAIWQRHNCWLLDFEGPVQVKILEQPQREATLVRSGAYGQGQWKMAAGQPAPIAIALEHGFSGGHLSNANSWVIRVGLAELPQS